MRAQRWVLLVAVCGLRVSAALASADDAAVRRELEAHRTAATFNEADRHQAAALALLSTGVSPALRLEVEGIECQEDSFENDDADGQLWRQAQAGVVQARVNGQPTVEARFDLCAGNILTARGEYAAAAARYERALALARRAHAVSLEAATLNLRGALASARASFRDALVDLTRARDLFQAVGEPANLIGISNELAKLYSRLGDYATALAYFQGVHTAVVATGNDSDLSIILGNLASTNDALGRQAEAQANIAESLKYAERSKDPLQIAVVQMKRGRILDHAKQYGPALEELTRARQHFLQQHDKERLALTDLYMAQALEPLGRPMPALARVQAARAVFATNQSLLNLAEAQTLEARLLSSLGRDHEAYIAEQAGRVTSMLLARQTNDYQMILTQAASAVREQQAENASLRREVLAQWQVISERDRTRRWQRVALAAGVVVLLGITAWAWRQFRHGQRMRHLSLTDELTGLPNRRSILAFAASQLEYARRIRDPLTLMLLDIDHFKDVNDRFGHGAGDDVLRTVAASLVGAMRHGSRVGRTGGEEFFVVLPHTASDEALLAADRLRTAIAALRRDCAGQALQVTASFGVVTVPPGTGDLDALYDKADAALYAAKHRGRNRAVHHRDLTVPAAVSC